ncbi:MAG: glycosyltransferase [Acetatifactor sp.]
MNILIDGQTLETEEINRGIGVYFKNVVTNMIKQSVGNIWYITVSSEKAVLTLDRWTAGRVIPIVDRIFAPGADYERENAFSDRINQAVAEYRIDRFWCPNPLMVNVLFPNKKVNCPFYATVYDLIPYLMPVAEWEERITREYHRRLDYLKSVHLICISEATRADLRRIIGEEIKADVTLLAADRNLFYGERQEHVPDGRASIVYTGGFDYRKNMYGAVRAFAEAEKAMPDLEVTFSVVGKYSAENKEKMERYLDELGVRGSVRLTGFLPDEELARLYREADVFFFPSFYEGFGLPLLEAMLGGAYILSADNSSLPEVCAGHAMLCDAHDTEDMAGRIVESVRESLRESMESKRARQEYAGGFTWEKTAEKTLAILEDTGEQESFQRRKVALVAPWPKQQTGIANYVYQIVPYMSKHYDIDLFVDNSMDRDCELLPFEYGKRYTIDQLERQYGSYDEIIFHIGNCVRYHASTYKLFERLGGIVEIHDFDLNAFFYHAFYATGQKEIYRRVLKAGYGEAGELHFRKLEQKTENSDGAKFPMSHGVARQARKVIVHNEWSYRQLGPDVRKYLVPLACFETQKPDDGCGVARDRVREKIHYREGEIVIGCLGWMNSNKRPQVMIQSLVRLRQQGYPVKMVFWGNKGTEECNALIEREQLQEAVVITGYLEREEYLAGLELSDIILNLRYPTMGESSATLCETMKAGKPSLVTAVNQYLEFPDDVCWKVPLGRMEVPALTAMLQYMLEHEEMREAMAENARAYADRILNGENIADLYARALGDE